MPDRVGRLDRIMRVIYDRFGRGHDPALRVVLPLVDGISEGEARQRLLDRLPLQQLQAVAAERPLRVLDVSFGTAGELLGLARTLPVGTELFGVDLSSGMAALGARNLARAGVSAELCLGDAHHLPYRDETFDLVVHVGGINAFTDRRQALAEMVRVAPTGTASDSRRRRTVRR
ncbi:MAG: class I SAM-dependent methyltransferase [Proteobacteria bacterium]|nr:class I SAM-dependent methyltransferase [Pseudomonadota bacterium]